MRNFREQLIDPKLKEQISAFIGQEGFHTREHEDYNAALVDAGMPVEAMDKLVVELLEGVKKLPYSLQLAATVALEHLTAVLGDTLIRDPALLEGCDPHYAAIWRWHAIEETEHKAVCFDAYEVVMGKGTAAYALRTFAFVAANLIFWSFYMPFLLRMLQKSGGLADLKGWAKLANFVAGRPGVLPEWLDFFRPGFHPWMHDNRQYLAQAEALMREVAAFRADTGATPAPSAKPRTHTAAQAVTESRRRRPAANVELRQ